MTTLGTAQTILRNGLPDAFVGTRVHMLMWQDGITQTKLAPKLNLSQTGLSKKINGRVGWSVGELLTVAAELNTTVSYLVGETENRYPDGPDSGSENWCTPRDLNPEPTD